MHVIFARNVNDAYHQALALIRQQGVHYRSRNGPVLRLDAPVTTRYEVPWERVLFDDTRDANPFFHLFESLWMLNGQHDVETMEQFLKTFGQFSDDGRVFHGAYGYRWRAHFGHHTTSDSGIGSYTDWDSLDQLATVIRMLKANPYDRRCVIGMWDPDADLGATSKDIPCNDLIKCSMRGQTFEDRALDIHVYCRSNDIIWGCYGANAVHMSMLHEYLAAQIGVAVGHYYQISGDWHAYLDQPYHLKDFEHDRPDVLVNPYESGRITTMPLVTHPASFDAELAIVMLAVQNRAFDRLDCTTMRNAFFRVVAQPMYILHALWKEKKLEELGTLAARYTMHETNIDWLVSARDWIERRLLAKSARIARDMLNKQPIPRAVTFGGNMEDS